ncbi:CAP domain-containing protein [Maribacter sp. ACAM166]|uniref:CAP domain-containing protein n=1 Tax=Maribacter sp. ACAM166 TaxID=2508996 RepID=UPI00148542E0|nr:CAP domain-containing protein [Maribacter sp. ACAM166]
MKLAFPYLALSVVLLSSCSKYENFAGYQDNTDDLSAKVTLVSSDIHNTLEAELFDMINNFRASIGLNEMVFESTTYYYAGIHTDYMIEKGNTSHDKFSERAENISKRTEAVFVAENVARNYDTLEDAFEAWLDSPGHRKNIEGDYNYSAISIRPNSNGDLYFTQLFFR